MLKTMRDNRKLSEMMILSLMMKGSDTKTMEVRFGIRLKMMKESRAPRKRAAKSM
jgi:hypothetical protein